MLCYEDEKREVSGVLCACLLCRFSFPPIFRCAIVNKCGFVGYGVSVVWLLLLLLLYILTGQIDRRARKRTDARGAQHMQQSGRQAGVGGGGGGGNSTRHCNTLYTGPVVGVGVEWEEIICKYADS